MANDTQVAQLKKEIDEVLKYDKDSLIRREKWGEITFEAAERDFNRSYELLNYLKILPVESLTDQSINEIISSITQLKTVFTTVDKFNISTGNPSGERQNIVTNIHNQTETLYRMAAPWISYLAYQKGDVAKNIEQLSAALNKSEKLIAETELSIKDKGKEIDEIIIKTREASAAAGAAVFTQDFQKESDTLADRAKTWLKATWMIAAGTLILAGLMWWFTEEGTDHLIWQKLVSKLAILGVLISATAWCGKIYKALIHQSLVNRHRALSLQTFQAFSSAASDLQTKDAVLMQTTKAIFSNSGSGFINENQQGSDSDIKVFEVLKSILPSNKP